jgi:RNA polymerase sigma factor (TIGR02999 family)
MEQAPSPITSLVRDWSTGNREAFDQLLPAVYSELRRLAHWHLRSLHGQTLQPTALVHEVYLRLVGGASLSWQDRAHFFAVAAQLMRCILVDRFRAASAEKRGGGSVPITLPESVAIEGMGDPDLIDLDVALNELAELDPQQARIVELRFFVGLSLEETAEVLGVSPATVKRDWAAARAWIQVRLSGDRG